MQDPHVLGDGARKWVRALAMFLIEKQKQQTGAWGYPDSREDFSNTQYALLGLRAAKDCGIPVPPGVWLRVLEHALARQEADGPKVKRIIPCEPTGWHDVCGRVR